MDGRQQPQRTGPMAGEPVDPTRALPHLGAERAGGARRPGDTRPGTASSGRGDRGGAKRSGRPAAPGRAGGPGGAGARPVNPTLWVLGMLSVVVAFAAAYWGFVQTATGQLADDNALRGAVAYLDADTARRPALTVLGYMPELSAVVAALALLAAAIARRSLFAPAVAALSFTGAVVSTQVLKHLILDRPDKNISEASVNSFPSGHTTFAAAAMVAVLVVAAPRWRPLVAALGGWFAALAGGATFVLGWHRPADILAAYLVAAFWGLLGGLVVMRRERHWNSVDGPGGHWASARLWQAALWLPGTAGVLGSAAVYWYALGYDAGRGTGTLLLHLLAGVLFIVGSATFLFGLGGALFAHQARSRPRRR